jgi:hypothetical protein
MKNIFRLWLMVTAAIFAVLLHDMYLNGYSRLQNFNEILHLQHFWIHLVVVFSCAMTIFFGAYMCSVTIAGIFVVPSIPCRKRLLITLITLFEFSFYGLCSAWLWLVWIPNALVDFTSCIIHSTFVVSVSTIVNFAINMVAQRTTFSRMNPIHTWNASKIFQFFLLAFFAVPIGSFIVLLVLTGSILSGLWLMMYCVSIVFLLFINTRFDRLIQFGQLRILHCSLLYSLD